MRPKILVVDDERAILDTVEILLRGEGFDAAVAQTGREALDRFDDAMHTEQRHVRAELDYALSVVFQVGAGRKALSLPGVQRRCEQIGGDPANGDTRFARVRKAARGERTRRQHLLHESYSKRRR